MICIRIRRLASALSAAELVHGIAGATGPEAGEYQGRTAINICLMFKAEDAEDRTQTAFGIRPKTWAII
jgi:hypothetical protein